MENAMRLQTAEGAAANPCGRHNAEGGVRVRAFPQGQGHPTLEGWGAQVGGEEGGGAVQPSS